MTERAHVTLVVDRSGSMSAMADEAEQGIARFMKEQAEIDDVAVTISVVQFDDVYEHVFGPTDAKDAPAYRLVPRAFTALYDAVGRAIEDTRKWVDSDTKKVVVVIATDGQENASKEHTFESVTAQIERAKADGWEFIFLAGTIEAKKFSLASGIQNTTSYDPNQRGQTQAIYDTASAGTRSYLSGQSRTVVMPDAVEDDDAP